MKYKNPKQFYKAVDAIHNPSKDYALKRYSSLGTDLLNEVKGIPFYQTHSFRRRLFFQIIIALIVLMVGTILIALNVNKGNVIAWQVWIIVLQVIWYLLLGGCKTNYEHEAFYRIKEIKGKIISKILSQQKSFQECIDKNQGDVSIMRNAAFAKDIRQLIKGQNEKHAIDYMLDDGVCKYWNDLVKPAREKELKEKIDHQERVFKYLKEEEEFLQSL